jgi:transposase InsO family protein
MDIHKNARLTLIVRTELVRTVLEEGFTLKRAAARFNVSAKTAAKWVRRFREEGAGGLHQRSSRPLCSPMRVADTLVRQALELRRRRHTVYRIAQALGLSPATVSRILRRHQMNRLTALDPPPAPRRYEHKRPGDLIHFDIKRLARIVRPGHRVHGDRTRETRGAGYEYLHVAIDDHTRISFAAILPDQKHTSAILFLHMARAHFSRFGISCRAILTDNGSCYRHHLFGTTMRSLALGHRFTRIYRPQTNGKAERFIQTALREWAYARTYQISAQRTELLDIWLHDYNFHRPHASLNYKSPASRAGLNRNNLLTLHI